MIKTLKILRGYRLALGGGLVNGFYFFFKKNKKPFTKPLAKLKNG
jgi:hypothetical protein